MLVSMQPVAASISQKWGVCRGSGVGFVHKIATRVVKSSHTGSFADIVEGRGGSLASSSCPRPICQSVHVSFWNGAVKPCLAT